MIGAIVLIIIILVGITFGSIFAIADVDKGEGENK